VYGINDGRSIRGFRPTRPPLNGDAAVIRGGSLRLLNRMSAVTGENALSEFLTYDAAALLPPPKKEVMFLDRSVCLSVRRITRKLVNGF